MKIKDRIAVYFTLISTSLLFAVLCTVYFTFLKFLEADFFERLTDRTMVTAKLYLEADEISRDALNTVRHKYLQKLNGEVIRVYNSKNRATFIGDSAQYWTTATIDRVRKEGHLQYRDGQRQVVGIYYKDNQGHFVILASGDDQGSHNRLQKLLKIMIIVFVLISILILLLSHWIAKKMLHPLMLFMQEVKQIGSKNMEFRVQEPGNRDEISLIAQSFNQLMKELEQAFTLQKSFVANASHELRTPITRMVMTAELALSKNRDADTYQKALHEVLDDAAKMEHIITGLLTLARMDLDLINSQLSIIQLQTLLLQIQEEWAFKHQLKLTLLFELSEPQTAPVLANATLLRIAVENIISNAFKFSANQEVFCTLGKSDTNFYIDIRDQGPGIPMAQQQDIFKAFYTRSAEAGYTGNGMGLYMAHKIIDLFKGSILLRSESTLGSTFSILLPELTGF